MTRFTLPFALSYYVLGKTIFHLEWLAGHNLNLQLESSVINIELNKIITCTIDNESNVQKSVKDLFGSNRSLGCFAHHLDFLVEESRDAIPEIRNLFTHVKDLVTFFKQSVVAYDRLKAAQANDGKLNLYK